MAWRSLELSPSASAYLPPFLLSTAFDQKTRSYTVHLTDLTCIWSESLSRHEIIRRSQEEGTSIDPSDDDQLQILLEKIQLGLERGKDTASTLTINVDDDRPAITLRLTVQLPGGLAPLEWPIQLLPAPQSLLTTQLTVPLMGGQQVRMQELASLTELLKEKDHVIQKLLDKLESQGTDLAQVFPQAAGKKHGRRLDRTAAEERVKGLRPFGLQAWRRGLDSKESHDARQLISLVFSSDDSDALKIRAYEEQESSTEGWWDTIKGITVNLDSGKITTNFLPSKPPKVTSPPKNIERPSRAGQPPEKAPKDRESSSSEEDGDFQAQATPPHIRHMVNEFTDSEDDDLDAPSQRSKTSNGTPAVQQLPHRKTAAPLPKQSKKLGTVGGKKGPPKPALAGDVTTEGDISPRPSTYKKVDPIDGEQTESDPSLSNKGDVSTEDEALSAGHPSNKPGASRKNKSAPKAPQLPIADEEASTEDAFSSRNSSVERQARPPKASTSPTRSVFGKRGGKKQPQRTSSPTPSPEERTAPAPATPAKPKKGKLGQIGGKKEKQKDDSSVATATTKVNEYVQEKSPQKAKLGVIGKRREHKAASPVIPDTSEEEAGQRGRKIVQEERPRTPEPRETSKERADRKRAQLKRELEEKAKAPPTKKKRKF